MIRSLAIILLLASAALGTPIVSDTERFTVAGILTDSAGNPITADSFELWASKTGGSVRLVSAGRAQYLERLGAGYLFNTWVNVLTARQGPGIYSYNLQLNRGPRLVNANIGQLEVIGYPVAAALDSLRVLRSLADSLQAALDTIRGLAGYVVRGVAPVRQVSQIGVNDRVNERLTYIRPNASGQPPDTFVIGVEQIGADRDPRRALLTFQWLRNGPVWLDWHWSQVEASRAYAYRQVDVNRDGQMDISDLAALIDELILGAPATPPDTTGIFKNQE